MPELEVVTAEKESTTKVTQTQSETAAPEKETQKAEKQEKKKTPPAPKPEKETESETQAALTCTLTIECKSILENMNELKNGHEAYVPKSGYILKDYTCTFEKGDTVYDVFIRAAKANNIKVSEKETVYDIYISGINNLDEFDVGKDKGWTSGWIYTVNGEFATTSSSIRKVKNKDKIVFSYSCNYD